MKKEKTRIDTYSLSEEEIEKIIHEHLDSKGVPTTGRGSIDYHQYRTPWGWSGLRSISIKVAV